MEVLRFDFNGSSGEFKRTSQGFLRVNARLTKNSEEEVFRVDSLESIKGAPVTNLHPAEKGSESFLAPANAKKHLIGIAESIERDGTYLKGSLIIFDEDAIKAIEKGERKEISLDYKCRVEQMPGTVNGEAYDAVQRDIRSHRPEGLGQSRPDCAIHTDSKQHPQGNPYARNPESRRRGCSIDR